MGEAPGFSVEHLALQASLNPDRSRERPGILPRMRCDELRLTGSGGANRVMEAELKRLVMRSPFEVRLPKPRREGEATLLYPFDARISWVAACHHRTSSRISWDLFSSTCLLYTSDAADDLLCVDLGGRRIIKKKKK